MTHLPFHAVRTLSASVLAAATRDESIFHFDEDMACLHFGGFDTIDSDDVVAEHGLDHGAEHARAKREHPLLELRNHHSTSVPAKVATHLASALVHRLVLCHLCKQVTIRVRADLLELHEN